MEKIDNPLGDINRLKSEDDETQHDCTVRLQKDVI